MYIVAPHEAWNAEQIVNVREAMQTLGRPVVRAWNDGNGCWRAIEGAHRISVAMEDGVGVEISELDLEDVISDHDMEDLPAEVTVAEILEYLSDSQAYYCLDN